MRANDFVDDCIDALRALPPVLGLTLPADGDPRTGDHVRPIVVDLDTGGEGHAYRLLALPVERPTRTAIDLAASHLELLRQHLTERGEGPVLPVILAPHLGRALMQHIVGRGLGCVDAAGNAHLALEPDHYIHIEGRPAPKVRRTSKVIRAAGYRVLFTFMVHPEYLDAPLRMVAEHADTSVRAVQNMREWLAAQRFVHPTREGTRWNPDARPRLLNLWLVGYQTVLRPSLVVGGLDLGWHPTKITDPAAREDEIQSRLIEAGHTFEHWRWGGSSAAYRVDGQYRESAVSTLHVDLKCFGEAGNTLRELADVLSARPSRDGMVRILDIPNQCAMSEAEDDPEWQDVVDPLLIWAETMLSADPRAREAAQSILRYTELDASSLQ